MLQASRQDLRYAFRRLAHDPGFTFLVVLTLSPRIDANSAIFNAVDAAMLRFLREGV